jgi:hypothetical protein
VEPRAGLLVAVAKPGSPEDGRDERVRLVGLRGVWVEDADPREPVVGRVELARRERRARPGQQRPRSVRTAPEQRATGEGEREDEAQRPGSAHRDPEHRVSSLEIRDARVAIP